MTPPRTRLAPSPTGSLHLGNARTFLVNWALARRNGWRIVLRIEDLDGPRIKPGADRAAIELLHWLGVDWDEGPHYQLHDLTRYRAALHRLVEMGRIYPCHCTRSKVVSAQSAPHGGEPRYPGTCRPKSSSPIHYDPSLEACWRFIAPDVTTRFTDGFSGEKSINVQHSIGDFVVATKTGLPSYQLAVVVDDAAQGITHVVRGDDLIDSTPRQMLLYDALDLSPRPSYIHLPLVIGADGKRLAKRHGETRLSLLRDRGLSKERVLGLLARWCGIGSHGEMSSREFLDSFELARVPHNPITWSEEDEAWLSTMPSSRSSF